MSDASIIGRPRSARSVDSAGALRLLFVALAALGAAADAAGDDPAADIPRTADGKPDFSGIWESMSGADYDLEPHAGREDAPPGAGVVVGHYLPYQPWAREQRDRNFAARATADHTRLNCYTLGVPRAVYYPAPFQIFQRPRDLTIVTQFGAVRTIHTNGTLHPKGPFGFWLGDSRGHWEGDTLVVDVVDFNDKTWLDRAGNFHSDAMRVVERWTYLDANTIEYRATIDDPKVFTRPWELGVILYRHREKNFQLIENYCYTLEYDEYYPFPADERNGE
ncbi:MAG TPA: hypothetical protein VF339_19620 [Gammaproteobacteria bacterium]